MTGDDALAETVGAPRDVIETFPGPAAAGVPLQGPEHRFRAVTDAYRAFLGWPGGGDTEIEVADSGHRREPVGISASAACGPT